MALSPVGALAADLAIEQHGSEVRLWSAGTSGAVISLAPERTVHAAVEAEGGLVVAGRDGRTGRLFLTRMEDGAAVDLPVPGRSGARGQYRPILLAADGRVEAALWLEGPWEQDAGIYAAAWNGTSWETTEVVSSRRGAAQLALTGTVLADGSWLVLWAGFDGTDDEIFWSRRVDGEWSPPQRVHDDNRVPDILPTIVDSGDGALAAWSFYDGNDYRVRAADWRDGRWRVRAPFSERGALEARWQRLGERRLLTYRSVEPQAWVLTEADEEGRLRRRARVRSAFDERPLVVVDGRSLHLVWPWQPGSGPR